MPGLKQGAIGPEVRSVQIRLKALGFDPKGVDGKFGEDTRDAVVAFQISKELPPSGQVGPETLEMLGPLAGIPTRCRRQNLPSRAHPRPLRSPPQL